MIHKFTNAIANQIVNDNIIAELEQIKAEINKLTRYYTTESGKINLISDNAVYRIIDKHIAELKENKE